MTPFLNPRLHAAMARWPADLRFRAEERAAIREEAGESREQAESGAFIEASAEERAAVVPAGGRRGGRSDARRIEW